MLKNWEMIEDYEVDITLSLDIPGFRMPERHIHYYYKAPDKTKIEVKGFAIVPKQGIQPFFTFFKDSLKLEITGTSEYRGKPVYEVAFADTFMTRKANISFLVDQENGNIYKGSVIHEDREFFSIETRFLLMEDGISMPAETSLLMHFPPNFRNLQHLGKKPQDIKKFEESTMDEWLEGSIQVLFENYKLNRGLPDYLFEEDIEDSVD